MIDASSSFSRSRQRAAALILAVSIPVLAAAQTSRDSLVVGPVTITKGARDNVSCCWTAGELDVFIASLDTTLTAQLHATRKFDLIAGREQIGSILAEQDFGQSGRVDPETAARIGEITGAKYVLLTTITDFRAERGELKFKTAGVEASRERVRLGCSLQIFDTSTAKLREAVQFRGREMLVTRDDPTARGEIITRLGDRLAAYAATRVLDVLFPAKVVAMLGSQVTLNRGEGAGIAAGQDWLVYALGEEIKDPDTGEILGRNEVEVGKIRVTRLTPTLGYAEIVEDFGIEVGAIVRAAAPEGVETGAEKKTPPTGGSAKRSPDW